MSLLELRNRSNTPAKTGLAAMRSHAADNKPKSKQSIHAPFASSDEQRTAILQSEYDKMPWYQQLGTSADDLARLGASGISFGQLDEWLGPEAKAATRDAALRSGWAGTAAEVGGAVASPITRTIGAGASLLRPAGKGLVKALTNLGVTGLEGGAISAVDSALNGGNVQDDAQTGAGLAAGTEGILKHLLPKSAGLLSNILSKVPMKDLSDIYDIASKSSLGADAVKQVQKGKAPVKLIDAIDNTRTKLEGKTVPNSDEIEESLVNVFGRTTTSSGHKALDAQDQAIVNRLFDKAYNSKVDATTFNRNNLDDLAAYLEETKVAPAAEKSTGGMHVKNVHDTIKKVGSEADPNFKKLMDYFDIRKKAYTAGKATSTISPNTRAFDTARDVGLATAFIAGSAALTNPVLLAAIAPMLTAASPRAVGTIARKAGSTKRNLKKIVPKNTGYGTMGVLPGIGDE